MSKKYVAVLDFGSSKITILVGTRYVSDNFRIISSSEVQYAGFIKGRFLEEDNLSEIINQGIQNAEKQLGSKIDKLYVGVPSEFCFNKTVLQSSCFKKSTKIAEKHIKKLLTDVVDDGIVIHKNPLCFLLDDDALVCNPIGIYSKNFNCKVSIIYIQESIYDFFNKIFKKCCIKKVEYVCSLLATGTYLFDISTKDSGAILIDCGYITSSVGFFYGDGLIDLKSFSMGGGHITGDLFEVLGLTFIDSEAIKRNLIINLESSGLDVYETKSKTPIKVSIKQANEVALARIDLIIDLIKKCIDDMSQGIKNDTKIYLTGGGLSYIFGIENYMKKVLNREVLVISPKAVALAKPDLSSVIGLLNYGLLIEST